MSIMVDMGIRGTTNDKLLQNDASQDKFDKLTQNNGSDETQLPLSFSITLLA